VAVLRFSPRQQLRAAGAGQDLCEEGVGYLACEQALAVLGEDRGVPDGLVEREAHKPAQPQVVVPLLPQQARAAHRVEDVQEQGPQQALGGDGGTAGLGIERLAAVPQPHQGGINHLAEGTQRVLWRHALLQRDITERRRLLLIDSPPDLGLLFPRQVVRRHT
jgi:hypothetical protein